MYDIQFPNGMLNWHLTLKFLSITTYKYTLLELGLTANVRMLVYMHTYVCYITYAPYQQIA